MFLTPTAAVLELRRPAPASSRFPLPPHFAGEGSHERARSTDSVARTPVTPIADHAGEGGRRAANGEARPSPQRSVRGDTTRAPMPATLHSQSLLPSPAKGGGRGKIPEEARDDVLRMELVGANHNAKIEGVDPLPGKSNYFIGSDLKRWHTDIPTYARVRYRNVYPGIDLVYYGTNQRQLEYDFVLSPRANPKAIKLRFDGARKIALNRDGDVIAMLPGGGKVIQHLPAIYQERDGHRERIDGRCVLRGKDAVGFEIAKYDRSRAIDIDPGLVYSTYLGGSGSVSAIAGGDSGNGVAVDSSGNAYVTGEAESTDFPITSGAFQIVGGGNTFVTEIKPDGMALVYSTYLGGTGGDAGYGIAVDSAGNAYVTGATASIDFPVTPRAFQIVNNAAGNSGLNAFVTKLAANGSGLIYSTYLGGSGGPLGDAGSGIAIDSTGSAYVTGQTDSTDFPTTSGAFQTTMRGSSGAFVTKLNPSGTALIYSTYLGGSDHFGSDPYLNFGSAIAVNAAGFAYVTGATISTDFPTTLGAFQITNHGTYESGYNAFVTKLNKPGSGLVYSTYLGGSDGNTGDGIAVDSEGNAYVTGFTSAIRNSNCTGYFSPQECCTGKHTGRCKAFPTTLGAFQRVNNAAVSGTGNGGNAFVTKLNAPGTALIYSTYLGGGTLDGGIGIALDSTGDACITGSTFSITNSNCTGDGVPAPCCSGGGTGTCLGFPSTADAFQDMNRAAARHSSNAFLAKLNAPGSALLYSTYLGGSGISTLIGGEGGSAVAIDSAGSAYVTGVTFSADFPVTHDAFQIVNRGALNQASNAFITKFDTLPITAIVSVSPPRVSFHTHPVGSTTEKSIKVSANKSNKQPILIENIAVSGVDYTFDTAASTCSVGASLAPRQSCAIAIKFMPSAVTKGKTDTGQLTVSTDAEIVKPPGGVVPLKGGGK
ncbi:MAG: SBBP repeat-containing protein [Candidatus Binataceae bacterium]